MWTATSDASVAAVARVQRLQQQRQLIRSQLSARLVLAWS
jgi:hypothetical protein